MQLLALPVSNEIESVCRDEKNQQMLSIQHVLNVTVSRFSLSLLIIKHLALLLTLTESLFPLDSLESRRDRFKKQLLTSHLVRLMLLKLRRKILSLHTERRRAYVCELCQHEYRSTEYLHGTHVKQFSRWIQQQSSVVQFPTTEIVNMVCAEQRESESQ